MFLAQGVVAKAQVRHEGGEPEQPVGPLLVVEGAEVVVHLAACNRPPEGKSLDEAAEMTRDAGERTAAALRAAAVAPRRVSVAGTTQTGTAYGVAKAAAGANRAAVTEKTSLSSGSGSNR